MKFRYTAGFVGAGNMGGALAAAACKAAAPAQVIVSCRTAAHAQAVAAQLGCDWGTAADAVKQSRFIFLGVKPQMLDAVAQELAEAFREANGVLVSMLAGVSLARLESLFGKERKILRIMPNTPCAVGSGMILLCKNDAAAAADADAFCALMAQAGRVDMLPERLIDAGSAVTGCGPAFVYMFIQALADGGVECGLPRAQAQQYAEQLVLGSAQLALQTGKHPEQLKDEVCSPGGSTIAGVHALEEQAFRSACMNAVTAAWRRTTQLG